MILSLPRDGSAVLAAVQDASRRLHRCRKRHPGLRLRAALCPPAGRDEGMAAPVEQRDKKITLMQIFCLTNKPPYKGWGEGGRIIQASMRSARWLRHNQHVI